eukprot:5305860-Amphidinium_carterae.1
MGIRGTCYANNISHDDSISTGKQCVNLQARCHSASCHDLQTLGATTMYRLAVITKMLGASFYEICDSGFYTSSSGNILLPCVMLRVLTTD